MTPGCFITPRDFLRGISLHNPHGAPRFESRRGRAVAETFGHWTCRLGLCDKRSVRASWTLYPLTMATAVAAPTGALSRVWAAYLRQLGARPLRTKMITSGCLFLLGDTIAQFGVEGRKVGVEQPPEEADADVPRPWDVSGVYVRADDSPYAQHECVSVGPVETKLTTDGGVVFAPLAHTWLGVVDKIRYASKFRSAWGVGYKSQLADSSSRDKVGT